MEFATKKANGLDRAELVRISRLPDAERPATLYAYICEKVMGRRPAPVAVTYQHGVYDITGRKTSDPRVRVTSDAGIQLPPGRTLRKEPEGQYIGKSGHTQQLAGSYALYFDCKDKEPPVRIILINGRPGERRYDPDGQRYVDTLEEEAVNIEHGYRTVDTVGSRRLFCFLELHPANFGSPVRNPDDCASLGFSVTTDEDQMARGVRVRTDAKLALDVAKVMDEARELEILAKLQACDPVVLRKTAKACGMSALIAGTDHVPQYHAYLKEIIQSKDTGEATRNRQEIIRTALSGDEAFVERLVRDAHALGVLTVSEGEYFCNGDHWDAFICPDTRAGEELDHLVSILSVPGQQKWVDILDTAVTAAKNDVLKADTLYEQHDREIEKALAAEIICKEKNRWVVKDGDGVSHDLVGVAIGSKEKQLEGLKAWARNQNIEKLKERLALLYLQE